VSGYDGRDWLSIPRHEPHNLLSAYTLANNKAKIGNHYLQRNMPGDYFNGEWCAEMYLAGGGGDVLA